MKIGQKRVGLGIVIKISEGKLVVAAIKPTKCFDKVGYAEAEAAHLGLEAAKNTGSIFTPDY